MKSDLERAREALAGGRTGEASVYAWNALASIGPEEAQELARIARGLGDSRLLGESHRALSAVCRAHTAHQHALGAAIPLR